MGQLNLPPWTSLIRYFTLGLTLRGAVKFASVDIFNSLFYRPNCYIIIFVATRSLCHVARREEDATLL